MHKLSKKYETDEVMQKITNLHDAIKEHPYWRIFDHGMFRNEVCKMFHDLMNAVSDLFYKTDYPETPLFCVHMGIFHNFSQMLGCIAYEKCEDTDAFRQFYLPCLQAYLMGIHNLIRGMDDDASLVVFYVPNDNSNPKMLMKYVPEYKDSWTDNEGYVIYKEPGWHSVVSIRESEVDDYLGKLARIIEKYRKNKKDKYSQTLIEWFEASKRDINNRTGFVYKVE